ncbi:Elongin-A [Hanseniaspora osmophila]|uniref:Elongin-A n=1 Tax=Hanseniaspora osmophila TaxID=56408 RepID=A0A1E5RNV8_9ASCO|nr:Elongin-A [Hanseniaspora osmophila]
MPDPQIKDRLKAADPCRKCKSLLESCRIQIVQTLNNNTGISPAFFCTRIKQNVPYHLLSSILSKVNNYEIVEKLELQNPGLVFLTEDIWRGLLRKDFPNNLHESFTKNERTVYKKLLNETQLERSYQDPSLNNFFLEYDESRQMYKIPSKLLYLKYKEELIARENEAKTNLINRNKNMQKMNESKSIVFLEKDEDLNAVLGQTVNKYGTNMVKKDGSNKIPRSKLFAKSMNQHKEHYSRIFNDSRKRKRLMEISGGARAPVNKSDGISSVSNLTQNQHTSREIKKVKVSLSKSLLSTKRPHANEQVDQPLGKSSFGIDTATSAEQPNTHIFPNKKTEPSKLRNIQESFPITTGTLTKKKSSFFTNNNNNNNNNNSSSSGPKNVYIYDKSQTKRPS